MLLIDMSGTRARVSLAEIRHAEGRWMSNPIAFLSFVKGIRLRPEALLDRRWQQSADLSHGGAYARVVLHEIVPKHCDVRHLETLGGRFALRVTGIGDFTVVALNRRVVTLTGLPVDRESGAEIIDAEISVIALQAVFNDRLAILAERVLTAFGEPLLDVSPPAHSCRACG